MNTDKHYPADERCAVCGKDTAGGRGFITLHLEGRQIPLCCPQCQKVYEESPALHLRRLHTRETIRDIEHALGCQSPE